MASMNFEYGANWSTDRNGDLMLAVGGGGLYARIFHFSIYSRFV